MCCAVRGSLVVLGGETEFSYGQDSLDPDYYASVEILSKGQGAFTDLPPLSIGEIREAAAIAVEESDSAAGQVLLLGGTVASENDPPMTAVYLVDLATGVCTPQVDLLHGRYESAVARLPDSRVVCAGGFDGDDDSVSTAEIWEPPGQGALDAAWMWRDLPAMSVGRFGCGGCVLSDGRFAVLGGCIDNYDQTSSCEALTVGDDEHWEPMPPMRNVRMRFACVAVAKCVIVVGKPYLNQNPKPETRNLKPKPKTQNPKPKTQNPKPKTPNPKPKPKTQNPKPKTQNPKPKTKNPEPKTQNPKPKIQNLPGKTQNPKLKTQNPKPKTQNSKPKTQNPIPNTQHPIPKTHKIQNPKPKARNPKPKTQNPKPKTLNPKT
jgi:hypothetical protein